MQEMAVSFSKGKQSMTEKKREDVSKKLVGLSNSRLKYPNLGRIDENDEFRCSVDRITLECKKLHSLGFLSNLRRIEAV